MKKTIILFSILLVSSMIFSKGARDLDFASKDYLLATGLSTNYNGWTVEVCIKPTRYATEAVVAFWNGAGSICYLSNGIPWYNNSGGVTGNPLPLNQWSWVTYVVDTAEDSVMYYVDGEPWAGRNLSANTDIRRLIVGNYDPTGIQPFDGEVAELRFWDIALSTEQVKTYAWRKFNYRVDNLTRNYHFDEDAGTVFDWSGNGDHLKTISGTIATNEAPVIEDE
jgi:hypothetical protein